ncbi:DDT domain-containing protein DDR4 [Dendrobium catenatum]|uniref:DDT domain-containing protein DDR4 n=1 Tax=Dendrobium catenatum TaxID=906689 RepID=A0A2I0WTI4_9ASPA|nr:DDT domain-containing protein DDR4 [Dendrobium catenatum]PKU78953.1 hypothetical protein MA16_Dca000297 [Dendrobium catenatum]
MAEGRRLLRSSTHSNCIPEKLLLGDLNADPLLIDEQRARIQLRQRWELAYVLNFLRVFRPVIPRNLMIPAEDIETALIAANKNLGRIHIALLKGIPPINKSLKDPDAWITSVCRKLAKWWSLVAEGENPLRADHGREIPLYKKLDPTTRLLILKALCDIRAEQDDILQFIAEELKKGTIVGSFRKEKMEVGDSGVTYWYEGDRVIGYRLYREIGKTCSKQKAKGTDWVEPPTFDSHWETIAINLEEFQGIMDRLSSSKVPGESLVGETIKAKILPVLKKIEKKKAQQERLALQLEGFLNCRVGTTRSCRTRRPARYTFDEYDRSIDEAIMISTEANNVKPRKANGEEDKNGLSKEYPSSNGRNMDTLNENSGNDEDLKSSEIRNDLKNWDNLSNCDSEDDDYDGFGDRTGTDDEDDNKVYSDSDKENVIPPSKPARRRQNFDAYHVLTKKRMRQRPTKNAGYTEVISDSEDEKPAKNLKPITVDLSSTEDSSSAKSEEESGEDLS